MLRDDIENSLLAHFESTRAIIVEYTQKGLSPPAADAPLNETIKQILLRVQERASFNLRGECKE
jgi:hypothetical protein